MRKVHYRVVLDVLVYEEEKVDGIDSLGSAHFWPTLDETDIEVVDVSIESVGVNDSQ